MKHPGYTFQGYVGEILEWNKPKEGQVVHLFFFHAVLLCRCSISEAPEISHGYHQGSPDFFQKYLKWRNPHRHMSCMWYGLCKAIYPPPNIPENQVQYLDFRYLRFLVIVPSKKVGSTKPPPEGKDYKLYMFPANWGIIHMPPIPLLREPETAIEGLSTPNCQFHLVPLAPWRREQFESRPTVKCAEKNP